MSDKRKPRNRWKRFLRALGHFKTTVQRPEEVALPIGVRLYVPGGQIRTFFIAGAMDPNSGLAMGMVKRVFDDAVSARLEICEAEFSVCYDRYPL